MAGRQFTTDTSRQAVSEVMSVIQCDSETQQLAKYQYVLWYQLL